MLDGDQIVLVAGVRTAVGRFGGGLKDVDAHVLAATCIREALRRAEVEPTEVPRAIAYYRALERRSDVVFQASPFREGADPVPFNFDWSFDYYPLAYAQPGPEMTIYRLKGGACSPNSGAS